MYLELRCESITHKLHIFMYIIVCTHSAQKYDLILFNNYLSNRTFEKVLNDRLNTFCVINRTFELSVYSYE